MEENNCPEFVKPLKRVCPTNFLYISNANTNSENIKINLIEIFSKFGEFNLNFGPIFISKKKVYNLIFFLSFISFFYFTYFLYFLLFFS